MNQVTLTLIGGPTVLIELGNLRLLTDPTFDPANSTYQLGPVTLSKLGNPALSAESLGHIDAILLSHEQHSDNFDAAGRAFAATVERVFTTVQSASNVGHNAIGLAPWQARYLTAPSGRRLKITATPARHGPEGAEQFSGEVIGFVLNWEDEAGAAVYISGDTVWYEDLEEIARRFDIDVAVVNLGAARIDVIGPVNLTMSGADGIRTAQTFSKAKIVPAHYEGWKHFSESRAEVVQVFAEAGLTNRLQWLEPGVATVVL